MTDQELRELDVRIAERLGYRELESDNQCSERWQYPNGGKYSGIPSWSTSIEPAIELFEKLGPGYKLSQYSRVVAESHRWSVLSAKNEWQANTPALAIALAFDAAYKADVSTES